MNHFFHFLKKTGFYAAAFVFVVTGLVNLEAYNSSHYQAQVISENDEELESNDSKNQEGEEHDKNRGEDEYREDDDLYEDRDEDQDQEDEEDERGNDEDESSESDLNLPKDRSDFDHPDSEEFVEKMADRITKRVMQKLIASGVTPEALEGLSTEGFEDELDELLNFSDLLDDSEDRLSHFLERQGRVWERLKKVGERLDRIKEKHDNIGDKVEELREWVNKHMRDYKFPEGAAAEVQEALDQFINLVHSEELTDEEIEAAIDEFMDTLKIILEEANDESVEEGLAAFRDAASTWFTEDALYANRKGIILGENGWLSPARDTNVAELVTVVGRAMELEIDESATSNLDLPEWAQPFAAALEAEGVDLIGIFGEKTGANKATRAEAAMLIADAFNLELGSEDLLDEFSDVDDETDNELRQAIRGVAFASIMTGEGEEDEDGKRLFNPHTTVNRAVLTRLVRLIAEYSEMNN